MSRTVTTITLELPDTPDVNRLREMYEAERRKNECLQRNLGGVLFDRGLHDLITSCFPEDSTGLIADGSTFVRGALHNAVGDMVQLTHLRHEASMSGAMRWPWSQEARINNHELRYD